MRPDLFYRQSCYMYVKCITFRLKLKLNMELHSQALNFLCRLCGGRLSKYSHNKFELKRKIEKVCDIDVSTDATLLHPPKVCDTCRRKLGRKYKEKQTHNRIKTNSIQALHWIAHSDQCQICKTVSQVSEQGTDSSDYIKKCSDIFNMHPWVCANNFTRRCAHALCQINFRC